MNGEKTTIKTYIENRLTLGVDQLKHLTQDTRGRDLPRRSAALVIEKYLRDFNFGHSEPRWVVVPGLRGVGKTTLIAQLFTSLRAENTCKIYISLDDVRRTLGSTLDQILTTYEKEVLKVPFERLTKNVYIFLDEVQYDPTWALTLKTLYDRTKRVFIVCTGSSALSLQTNPDVARRVVFTKIYPLSFTEYRLLRYGQYPLKGLSNSIRKAIFSSESAPEVMAKLSGLQPDVERYWKGVSLGDFHEYLKFGTLPSAIAARHEPLIYTQINQTLNSIFNKDVPELNTFDKETLDKLSQILYATASYDTTSFTNISQMVGLNIKTVTSVFEAFEKTELLFRVFPYGQHETQVRKPSKYLFTSPAFRAMYYTLVGSIVPFEQYKGKLLEDAFGLYFRRIFQDSSSVTYDSAKGGADFIVGKGVEGSATVVIEAGFSKSSVEQAQQTAAKVGASYSCVFAHNVDLEMSSDEQCLFVPLKFFMTM